MTIDIALERRLVEANISKSQLWLQHELKSGFRTIRSITELVSKQLVKVYWCDGEVSGALSRNLERCPNDSKLSDSIRESIVAEGLAAKKEDGHE